MVFYVNELQICRQKKIINRVKGEYIMKSIGIFLWLVVIFVFVSFSHASQESKTSRSGIQVTDGKLGKGVTDREITEEASKFSLGEKVYLWLKVSGGSGDSITVTWKQGEHSYDVKLGLGGSPWRTWSYKTAAFAGDWSVTVTDNEGNVLKEMNFTVQEMGKQEPAPKQ